jgi:hypothetical protein
MTVQPLFMLSGKSLNFSRDHFHFEVSTEVSVPNVPGRINNGPEDFVLKSLDYSNVARFCASP